MKILFMGTPEFAVPALAALIRNDYAVAGCVTQPDKPKNRGQKLLPPPVKEFAAANQIPVFQPASLKNDSLMGVLTETNPDLIVVVAYGKILPEYVLNFPKLGCVNVHASLHRSFGAPAEQLGLQWG
jgi:methionyl-tRNA formyltransferase